MRNKKIILTCAAFIAGASLFVYFQTKDDMEGPSSTEESSPVQTTVNSSPEPKREERPAPVIPHFVAGRPSLVKKAEAVYGKQEDLPESARQPSSGKKRLIQKSPSEQSFTIKNANITFAQDLYACAEDECPKEKPLVVANGFFIMKGSPPKKIEAKSPSLVTYNKETNQFGIWEKRVIIELKEEESMEKELAELKFSDIERPQPTLYIVQYNGETKDLDSTLSQIKQNRNVKEVRLEVTFSKVRPN